MSSHLETVRGNLERVRERIAAAAARAGRNASDITLVGVTKYVDVATTELLAEVGCYDLGESRPQQLWSKAKALQTDSIRWHMIGHLQRNKVDSTLPLASLLHSIDSPRLLSAIETSAAKQSLLVNGLLEVNCSGDLEKHGFMPEAMPAVLESLASSPRVRIRGLMTMAAREGGQDVARRNFAKLRELRDHLARNAPDGTSLAELSMGMSGDFEQAIEEGATIVRVGSSLWEGLDL